MGIDFGERRVGVAFSDESGSVAFPDRVLENGPDLLEKLAALATEKRVGAIVLGASVDLDGRENPLMTPIRNLGERLGKALGLPVFYEPEEFTSVEARAAGAGKSDAAAAAIILAGYLERGRAEEA